MLCLHICGIVVRASASQSIDLGFIPLVESYQKTLKNGIRSFPAWRSAFRGGCGEQAGKFACCVFGQGITYIAAAIAGPKYSDSLSREWRINMANKTNKTKTISLIWRSPPKKKSQSEQMRDLLLFSRSPPNSPSP